MTEAGLTVHRCAPHDPLYRLGGVCLLPVPAGPADGRGGVAVSWTTHSLLLLDWGRFGTCTGTQQAMNTASAASCAPSGTRPSRPAPAAPGWSPAAQAGSGGRTVTALTLAPDTGTGYEPAATAGVDRAIRVSTAIAVLAVAGVAAYVSYWHAYAVVCAHGETGVTARLEQATIDGLVYASSMVNLYAARHRLPVPALARWLLALGIVATLAANMAQGWSHGPVGAVIAAWPAVSLVGSYELLVWIIRTAAAGDLGRGPAADHGGPQADHYGTSLRLAAAQGPDAGPGNLIRQDTGLTPGGADGPLPVPGMAGTGQVSGPGWNAADHADQMADQAPATRAGDCRQPGRRHQRRRGGRLPRQPPGGQAAF